MYSVYYTTAPIDFEENKAYPQMKLMSYKGVSLYARRIGDQQYQVVQLCSSNLNDYLRQDIMPGCVIQL